MKIRKQNKTAAATATPTVSAATTTTSSYTADLKRQIREHGVFFDKLVELIPARFYLANDDADSKPWYKGLSKAAKASLKQQTKENIKIARRHRLDPDKVSQSSTLDLLNQSLQKHHPDDHDVVVETKLPIMFDENNENSKNSKNNNDNCGGGDDRSVTYEELREKLRKKIESLRGNRGGSEKNNNEKKGNEEKKRKRDDSESGKNVGGPSKKERGVDEGIEYGKVKLGDEEKRKKGKMSKAKELERAKRLEEVKKENPFVAEKESWKAATSRAMGEKVHDDPRLLKESLKKEKKRREKNAEKWKERVGRTEKMKEERQQKRKENIVGRARDKKARKIAKREKKLMRPGFEGRKEGFITQD